MDIRMAARDWLTVGLSLRRSSITSAILITALCGGCQTTQSILVQNCITVANADAKKALICRDGVAYSLPKSQVLMAASRHKVPATDSTADLIAAKANVDLRANQLAQATQDFAKCTAIKPAIDCTGVETKNVATAAANKGTADSILVKVSAIDQAQTAVTQANAKILKDTT